uniref:Uncharacterized protein n=1 Tax=Cannabis sativa TaxID=3483 RepID=A0A803QNU4_CANSA
MVFWKRTLRMEEYKMFQDSCGTAYLSLGSLLPKAVMVLERGVSSISLAAPHLPLRTYFTGFCVKDGITPFQLLLVAYKLLVGWFIFYKSRGKSAPTPKEISYFYELKSQPMRDYREYWFLTTGFPMKQVLAFSWDFKILEYVPETELTEELRQRIAFYEPFSKGELESMLPSNEEDLAEGLVFPKSNALLKHSNTAPHPRREDKRPKHSALEHSESERVGSLPARGQHTPILTQPRSNNTDRQLVLVTSNTLTQIQSK